MKRLPWLLVAICIEIATINLLLGVMPPIVPRLQAAHGGSALFPALVMAGHPLGSFLAAFPTVWWSRRYGMARTTVAGALGMLAATSLWLVAGHGWLLVGARMGQGFTGTVMWQSALAWAISSSAPSHRARTLGWVLCIGTVGSLIGPQLGTLSLTTGVWVFLVPALLCFGGALMLLAIPAYTFAEPTDSAAVRSALVSSAGVGAIACTSLSALTGLALNTRAPLILHRLGAHAFEIGVLFSVIAVLGGIASPVVGKAIDHGFKRYVLPSAFALGVVTLAGLAAAGEIHLAEVLVAAGSVSATSVSLCGAMFMTRAMANARIDQSVNFALGTVLWAPFALFGTLIVGGIPSSTLALLIVAAPLSAALLVISIPRLRPPVLGR